MKAIYLTGPNEFPFREIEDPVLKKDEVLIKVILVGICGTDVHLI